MSARYLVVRDHDTRAFTVEGPIAAEGPWFAAIHRLRQEGRRVSGRILARHPAFDLEREAAPLHRRQRPSGSILSLDARASA